MPTRERVLVTGACGRVGRAVIDDLLAHGHEAIAADRVQPATPLPTGVRFIEVDMLNVGEVAGALRGCTALIHLAAIPVAYSHADEVVFQNNVMATFTALQAASLIGVQVAAIASSGSAYGTAWSPQPTLVEYVPVDEAHPLNVFDAYGLSKEVDERTAEMFCRREGMTIAALRFHWVAREDEHRAALARYRRDAIGPDALRNLWGYVDLRDVATSCRLGIAVGRDRPFGFEAFNIVAADTTAADPTGDLIREFAPDIEIRAAIPGTASAFSCAKAARILGWTPRHSCRDA